MLTALKNRSLRAGGARFAIVASRYNGRYVDAMLKAAQAQLKRARVEHVEIVRVPGAFEIPAVAACFAASTYAPSVKPQVASSARRVPQTSTFKGPFDAIICLGVIFQGQTGHAQHIGWGVTHALAQIQVQYRIPVIHAVFVFEKEEHARIRCLSKTHNRGAEAAQTALAMAAVMGKLNFRHIEPVSGS